MEIKFSSEKFKSPDLRFMPVYSWVWNAPLDKDTIKNQIDDMLSAGIKAFYIIPEPPQFRPSSMVTTLSPEYLSDEFMDYIKYAFEYAQSNNMRVWIYDEGGWPSGSACGLVTKKDKSTRQKCLKAFKFELHAGEKYSAAENAVSAFDNGKKRIYDGEIISNDTWVTEYRREYVSDFRVDISEKNTTEVFIETTHEKYKSAVSEFFGKSVDYLFTDEPTCAMPAFPIGFERNFSEKYGYDICDYLYAIVGDNDNYSAFEKRVRADYGILIGELICSRFIEESRRWSNKNKIGFTGHLDLDNIVMGGIYRGYGNSLDMLRSFDMPGIDVIVDQIKKPDGRKPVMEGMAFFPRFASSAANQTGVNSAMSESFAVYGSGITADEMRYVINYQYARGINLTNFMIISYGRDDFLAFTERPSFSAEMPGYKNLRALNEYVSRLSYAMSIGRPIVDTALYYPVHDLWAGGVTAQKAGDNFIKLGEYLEENNIDFDIIDYKAVSEGEIIDGGLKFGGAYYKKIIIPDTEFTPEEVYKKYAQLDEISHFNIKIDSGFIKTKVRMSSDGDIILFAYNEGINYINAEISVENLYKSGNNVYLLDTMTGEINKYDFLTEGNNIKINVGFYCGESKILLISNKEFENKSNHESVIEKLILDKFEGSVTREFLVLPCGMRAYNKNNEFMPIKTGAWSEIFSKSFSGEVTYRAEFTVPQAAQYASKIKLVIEKLEYSAEVKVNGKYIGSCIFSPYTIESPIDCVNLNGTNFIEIIVANTEANQFIYSEAEKTWEKKELGSYHERAKDFEINTLGGGLYGKVMLEFLK